MYSYQALNVLIFLLPGFVATSFLDALTVPGKRTDFQRFVSALMLTFVIYIIYVLVLDNTPVLLMEQDQNGVKIYGIQLVKGAMVWLFIITVAISILLAVSINHDLHMKIFRKICITKRTSRVSVWHDVFMDQKHYIIVNFEDGRRIMGWPEHFCDDVNERSLFLSSPAWIDTSGDEQKVIELDNHGILITDNAKISTIEFVKHTMVEVSTNDNNQGSDGDDQ
ncbi:MAG: hypothetical protein JEZ02_20490 [Desulfatibacillum sp.]|nr:hypothetical protein [Desulfatibacillum sp.]